MFQEEPDMKVGEKLKYFLSAHWRGVLIVVVPLVLIPVLLPFPGLPWQWCAYCLLLMAVFWVTECIPLAVTAFFPVFIFPMTGVMNTSKVCKCYINDSVMMFVGSIMLAYSVEQSGLHKRLAYCTIRLIGYSHIKLLMAMCIVTTFVSMWITNTAATTMMVPINFAVLKVFEEQRLLTIYEKGPDGEKVASDITTCYFCAATYSATIGGIGTLVGTGTNLVFKGLFVSSYPAAPEYLSFPKFSAFAFPLMVVLELSTFFSLAIIYFGMFRKGSAVEKAATISEAGKEAAKKAIDEDWKKLGSVTFWEYMVMLLFGGAMVGFFCRSPQIFTGWGDHINTFFKLEDAKFVRDSSLAMLVVFVMFLLPSTTAIYKNYTAIKHEDLPKGSIPSVLQWAPMNAVMPYSYMFLLGGGFALSEAAKSSGFNAKIGEQLKNLKDMPNIVILLLIIVCTCFVTNFASNVAVCYVFAPIAMTLAKEVGQNPLWYNIAAGFTASFCFMIPVGTPGNLIVQGAANIPTKKMMKAGAGPTVASIIFTWLFIYFWAPVIWPDIKKLPDWAK